MKSPFHRTPAAPVASSALGPTRLSVAGCRRSAAPTEPYIAPRQVRRRPAADDDHRRATRALAAGTPAGWSGRSHSKSYGGWSMRIRVGSHGYALIVSEDKRLIAHGNPDETSAHRRPRPDRGASAELAFAAEFRARSQSPTRITATKADSRCWPSPPGVERARLDGHRRAADATRRWRTPGASNGSCSSSICPRPARHDHPRLPVGPQLHPAHLRADPRHPLDRRRQARYPRRHSAATTKSASSATPSTRWPIGWSSCRRTSASRSAR